MIVSILQRIRRRGWLLRATFAMLLAAGTASRTISVAAPAAAPAAPLAVKVLVINTWRAEAAPWPTSVVTASVTPCSSIRELVSAAARRPSSSSNRRSRRKVLNGVNWSEKSEEPKAK